MPGRVLLDGKSVQIPDVLADHEYAYGGATTLGELSHYPRRTAAARGDYLLAYLSLHALQYGRSPTSRSSWSTTFADQAVIAIENTRLFEAEQQRTRELTESLEQQTATSEVLQVISSSPGDLQPVFETMLENAVRICDAKFGNIYRWDGDAFTSLAAHNTPPAFAELRRRSPLRPHRIHPIAWWRPKTAIHVAI